MRWWRCCFPANQLARAIAAIPAACVRAIKADMETDGNLPCLLVSPGCAGRDGVQITKLPFHNPVVWIGFLPVLVKKTIVGLFRRQFF